jgi:hypothetical protein
VDIAGDLLVVGEDTYESLPARAHVYDLRTGRRLVDSGPPHTTVSTWSTVTDDGRYYYQAVSEGRECVGLVDLTTWIGSILDCPRGMVDGLQLDASEDGAAWVRTSGPDAGACRTGHAVVGRRAATVGPVGGCTTLEATVVGGTPVWGESPGAGGDLMLTAGENGRTVGLGRSEPMSLTMCGAYAYWRQPDSARETIQLRRWRPGLPRYEVAYEVRAPSDSATAYQIVVAGCADDIVTIQVFALGATGSRARVLALVSTT